MTIGFLEVPILLALLLLSDLGLTYLAEVEQLPQASMPLQFWIPIGSSHGSGNDEYLPPVPLIV
jgi:hypothetical protein